MAWKGIAKSPITKVGKVITFATKENWLLNGRVRGTDLMTGQ